MPTLSSNEKMLLRVVALTRELDDQGQERVCRASARTGDGFDLLVWQETGPERNGSATHAANVTVPADAVAVCAYAALLDRNSDNPDDDRLIWAIVDRTSFPAIETPSASPPTEATADANG